MPGRGPGAAVVQCGAAVRALDRPHADGRALPGVHALLAAVPETGLRAAAGAGAAACRRRPVGPQARSWPAGGSARPPRTGPPACARPGSRARRAPGRGSIDSWASAPRAMRKAASSRRPRARAGFRPICISARSVPGRSQPRSVRPNPAVAAFAFLRQLGWREFSNHLLYHNPDLDRANLQRAFDRMPWRDDPGGLRAWQSGRTGYPLVDAGMRELWTTGWMHNRARMVAASFLTKHLLIDWRLGARVVSGHARGRRPRQQQRRLAVGRGQRRRRRAVFPHLQPGCAVAAVRRRRRLSPPLAAGTAATAGQVDTTHPGKRRSLSSRTPACGWARRIRGPSWTMRRRANARSTSTGPLFARARDNIARSQFTYFDRIGHND